MRIFQKLTAILLFSLNSWMSLAYAYYDGQSELKIDGLNNTVAVWRVRSSNIFKLQGTYDTGNPWSVSDITQITDEDVIDYPALAASKDPSATTKAAVIWLSRDISTSRRNLKVSTYSGLNLIFS